MRPIQCKWWICVLLSVSVIIVQAMEIGERLNYRISTPYGSFNTKYQHFPPQTASSAVFPYRLSTSSTPLFSRTSLVSFLSPNPPQPAVVCIHGFGGNADQFRKNMPTLASAGYDTYGLDLLGYGYGDKPSPKSFPVNALYNFGTWSDQIIQFVSNEINNKPTKSSNWFQSKISLKPVVLVCNSVGGIAGLQAAIQRPDLIAGIVLIDVSLRLLHVKKQNPLQKVVIPLVQWVLRETALGPIFFKKVGGVGS
jgi:pimeloyl-ACP methyl ester carboxylesterase